MSAAIVAYLVVVALLGLAATLKASSWLARLSRRQRRQLEARRAMDAVKTESPIANPALTAKERGLESIESQFTVTRRVLFPAIFALTGILLGLPFVSHVPSAWVSIAVAAFAVLLGIVARPFLENALAGLALSTSKLFQIGDTVLVDDQYGTIEDITATHTTIKLWDWRRYVVPNSQMLQSKILNYSLFDRYNWAHVEFWVAYDADIETVRTIALESAVGCRYYAAYEEPAFWVMELGKTGIRCWVAAWADTPSDAWMLTHHMRTEIVRGFQAHGIKAHGYHHEVSSDGAPAMALAHSA